MKTIAQLTRGQARAVHAIDPDDTVLAAVESLAKYNIGALVVIRDGALVGILSERDCTRKVLLNDQSPHNVQVKEIMSTKVLFATPENTVDECMALMTDKRIRHLPVMQGEKVVSVISLGDLVKSIISEQKTLIQQLEQYITG